MPLATRASAGVRSNSPRMSAASGASGATTAVITSKPNPPPNRSEARPVVGTKCTTTGSLIVAPIAGKDRTDVAAGSRMRATAWRNRAVAVASVKASRSSGNQTTCELISSISALAASTFPFASRTAAGSPISASASAAARNCSSRQRVANNPARARCGRKASRRRMLSQSNGGLPVRR